MTIEDETGPRAPFFMSHATASDGRQVLRPPRRSLRSTVVSHCRAVDVPGLRARLGRLYACRIRRPPGSLLRFRVPRSARAVLGQPLHVWRRFRPDRSACRKILPFTLFETRRLVGALVGIVGLLVVWRTGRRIGGPLAGLFALVLLAACPLYVGHVFMNAKDGAIRGRDGDPAPRPRAHFRAISAAIARRRVCSPGSASDLRSARA